MIVDAGLIAEPVGGEPVGRRWVWVWVRCRGFRCFFCVRRVLHDVKEREREDFAELGAFLIGRPRGPLGCGVIRLLASLRVLRVSGGEIPYHHRGEAMDTERDYAANDGRKKTSSFIFFLLLLPCAIRAPGQPALAPATGRVERRLATPPRPLRQPLRQHNHEVPNLCAGLAHGVRSSLPLGCGAGDIGYTGKREEGKDDTVMRRDENGVSIRKNQREEA